MQGQRSAARGCITHASECNEACLLQNVCRCLHSSDASAIMRQLHWCG
jgi:hypothetical protein